MEGRDIVFIPMSGGVKEIPFWKDLAERWREKIKTLSLSDEIEPEPDDFPAPADEKQMGCFPVNAKCLSMKGKFFPRKAEKRIIL